MHVYVLVTAFPNGKVYFELTFCYQSQSKMKTFCFNFKVQMSNGLIEFVAMTVIYKDPSLLNVRVRSELTSLEQKHF